MSICRFPKVAFPEFQQQPTKKKTHEDVWKISQEKNDGKQ